MMLIIIIIINIIIIIFLLLSISYLFHSMWYVVHRLLLSYTCVFMMVLWYNSSYVHIYYMYCTGGSWWRQWCTCSSALQTLSTGLWRAHSTRLLHQPGSTYAIIILVNSTRAIHNIFYIIIIILIIYILMRRNTQHII